MRAFRRRLHPGRSSAGRAHRGVAEPQTSPMIPGISGPLLSHDALERVIPEALAGQLGEAERDVAWRRFRQWHRPVAARLGPSAAARTVFDQVAGPLVDRLGFRTARWIRPGHTTARCSKPTAPSSSVLIVTPWGHDLSGLWRDMVRHGLAWAARWCVSVSGPVPRVTDSQRTYARRFAEIDLQSAAEHDATFAVLWGLLRAAALIGPAPSVLDRAVAMSDQHRVSVRNSLQQGVEEALTRLTRAFLRAQHRRLRRAARRASASPVRGRIAGHHLSHPVSPLRGGARAGPEVASGLS